MSPHLLFRTLIALALFVATPAGAAPLLDVRAPVLLEAAEAHGFSLADMLGVPGAANMQALDAMSPGYRTLRETVAADVAELAAEMAKAGKPLSVAPKDETGRVIDIGWFSSPIAGFRLNGIVNRLDRRDFSALERKEDCGEVRLLYRLGYDAGRTADGTTRASRLPVSLNLVYTVKRPEAGCAEVARRWEPPQPAPDGDAFASWLAAGPLEPSVLVLKQVEINAQIMRLPSGQETGFGGQAAYLMRAFAAVPGAGPVRLVEKPLENTPDVVRLREDAALKAALVGYVKANLPAIDAGVFHLPDELSAKRAIAFTTFGSARLANHPFTAALEGADLSDVDLSGLDFIRTPAGLVERLDNASCAGCHHGGGTAGFHFFGIDTEGAGSDRNRVLQGISPHYAADQPRRAAYVEAVVEAREPNVFRPLSYAPAVAWESGPDATHRPDRSPHHTDWTLQSTSAGIGQPCLAGASARAFAKPWTCTAGSVCKVVGANRRLGIELGQCMPAKTEDVTAGLACLRGEVETGAAPYRDRWKKLRQINSFAPRPTASVYSCRPPRIGVPGGLAYRKCAEADRAFVDLKPGEVPAEICGLAGGEDFDRCATSGDFATCLKPATVRGMRPACGRNSFCREDYICQQLPGELDPEHRLGGETGFCSPTYFLFQMRIDGHPDPSPRTGRFADRLR